MIYRKALQGSRWCWCGMDGRRRRDDRSHKQNGQRESRPSGWDEVPSRDPTYDPTAPQPARYWDDGSGVPQGNPYEQYQPDPRYSFAPPQPVYAQPPPPLYANPYGYPPPYARPPNPGLAVAGGVLTLISGSLGIIWIALAFGDDSIFWLIGWGACYVVAIVMCVFAILGGIMAIMKRLFPLALIGAICGMLNGGFFGLTFFIGLIAVILLATSKDAFEPNVQAPPVYRY